ncbi:MAG: hypothetical protein RLZZ589_1946, partial [Cyanobacteriota bacterium]
LGLSEEVVRLTLMRVPRAVSLDTRVGREQDTELSELLEDSHATPEQELTREQLHADLEALLAELTSREAAVIRLRYGLEGPAQAAPAPAALPRARLPAEPGQRSRRALRPPWRGPVD